MRYKILFLFVSIALLQTIFYLKIDQPEAVHLKKSHYRHSELSESEEGYENERLNEYEFEVEVESNADNVLGLLMIPALELREMVVQGKDNEFYLNHDVYGNTDSYGCVFLDADNKLDDPLLIVYGHHVMNEDVRFSKLLKLFENEWNDTRISFLDKNWRIEGVIQTGIASSSDLFDLWMIDFVDKEHFKAYLRYLETLGDFTFKEYSGQQYLLLSTCLDINSEERVLVIAVEE